MAPGGGPSGSTGRCRDRRPLAEPRHQVDQAQRQLALRPAGADGGGPSGGADQPLCAWGVALWLARLGWPDPVRPHHLVVLVLDDVAVPDELPWVGEVEAESGDLAWIGDDRVLEAALPGLGWPRIADEPGRRHRLPTLIRFQRLAAHRL